jgi:hypothetical protein
MLFLPFVTHTQILQFCYKTFEHTYLGVYKIYFSLQTVDCVNQHKNCEKIDALKNVIEGSQIAVKVVSIIFKVPIVRTLTVVTVVRNIMKNVMVWTSLLHLYSSFLSPPHHCLLLLFSGPISPSFAPPLPPSSLFKRTHGAGITCILECKYILRNIM